MTMNTELIWQADFQQRVFRELVESFSRPGDIRDITNHDEPAGALTTVLATLLDGETSLADPHGQIEKTDWPLLQACDAATDTARFVVADGARPPDFQPALGTLASPEFGATLLLKVEALGCGSPTIQLSGPGIAGRRELRVTGLHADWLLQRANWNAGFPLGVDMILCAPSQIVALPRTTQVLMSP
jgi:alpha-D-ribose 1-methylphosphonate 5-triphosphate synthase subunit PhnH